MHDTLNGFKYTNHKIKITSLMLEFECGIRIDETSFYTRYDTKIRYANTLRKKYGEDILAAIAISAITKVDPRLKAPNNDKSGDAFIIRQLKTPEEVRLLRSVYGKQFIQISVYAHEQQRIERISAQIRIDSKGTADESAATKLASKLIATDQKEEEDYGQNLRDVFPLGDVFINSSNKVEASHQINRFFDALFGSNEVSPTREEYGMYLAKTASLRSSDLSRQVGAAIFSKGGDIVSLGSNEVPKAGGGTYWTAETPDARDFQKGYDPNEINKIEVFSDLIKRMAEDKLLNAELMNVGKEQAIVDKLLSMNEGKRYKDSRVMDIIEFGRIIHARNVSDLRCFSQRPRSERWNTILHDLPVPSMCKTHRSERNINRYIFRALPEELCGKAPQ